VSFRAISSALVVVVMLLLPGSAAAKYTPRYDLDSLAFDSDAVVAATKVSERKVDDTTLGTTFQITRVYASKVAGDIAVGKTIELSFSLFTFGPPANSDRGERGPEVEPEMVFFLTQPKDRPEPSLAEMRFFIDGRVQRFPQREYIEGFDYERAERPAGSKLSFDRAGFDVELQRAIKRASETRELLARPPSAARTTRLVELARDPRPGENRSDSLGAAIIVELGKTRELDAVLDAGAGSPRVQTFGLDHGIAVEALVEAAVHAATLERRHAALRLLGGMGFELSRRRDAVGPQLAALVDDSEPSIRLAVLGLWFTRLHTPMPMSDAIVARFAIEKDPFVRMEVYSRVRELDRGAQLNMAGIELPLVAARAHTIDGDDPSLTIEWTDSELHADTVIVELRDGDRLVHAEDLFRRTIGSSGGGDRNTFTVPLTFAAPVREREYDVTLDLILRRFAPGNHVERVHRRIPIGAAKVARLSAAGVTLRPSLLEPPSAPETTLWSRVVAGAPRKLALLALVVLVLTVGSMRFARSRRRPEG